MFISGRKVQQQRAPVDWILKPVCWIMKHVDRILELHGHMSTGSCSRVLTCRQDDSLMEKPVDSFGSGMPSAAKFHAAHAQHAAAAANSTSQHLNHAANHAEKPAKADQQADEGFRKRRSPTAEGFRKMEPSRSKNRENRATLRTSEVSTITFNPD